MSWVILDDRDPLIQWVSKKLEQPGGTQEYMETSSAGAQWSFSFTGSAIRCFGTAANSEATQLRFSLDGQSVTTYTSPVTSTILYHQTLFSANTLSNSSHTLTAQTTVSPNSAYLDWLIYKVYPNMQFTEDTVLFVDDRDESIKYSGSWGSIASPDQAIMATLTAALSSGASFEYNFTGTAVSVHGKAANTTSWSYTLDGQRGALGSGRFNRKIIALDDLPLAQHTLVFTAGDASGVSIDFILVHPGVRLEGSNTPTNSTSTSDSGGSGSPRNTGPLAGGIAAGAVVLVSIVIGNIWYFCFYKKRKANRRNSQQTLAFEGDSLLGSELATVTPYVHSPAGATVATSNSGSPSASTSQPGQPLDGYFHHQPTSHGEGTSPRPLPIPNTNIQRNETLPTYTE